MALWVTIWFLVVLKIPVLYLAWVIWWSVKDQPGADADEDSDGGGGTPFDRPPRPWPFRGRHDGPHGSPVRRPSRAPLPTARATRELT